MINKEVLNSRYIQLCNTIIKVGLDTSVLESLKFKYAPGKTRYDLFELIADMPKANTAKMVYLMDRIKDIFIDRNETVVIKVLFVDVDGCLNSGRDIINGLVQTTPIVGITPDKARLLKKIKSHTGCLVVLSSTWRIQSITRQMFAHICGAPESYTDIYGDERHEEIRAWLQEAKTSLKFDEVIHYAILDDSSDAFLPSSECMPGDEYGWFKCNSDIGLTEQMADSIISYLNTPAETLVKFMSNSVVDASKVRAKFNVMSDLGVGKAKTIQNSGLKPLVIKKKRGQNAR